MPLMLGRRIYGGEGGPPLPPESLVRLSLGAPVYGSVEGQGRGSI